MSLGDFLGDQSLGSWADEMEDSPLSGMWFVSRADFPPPPPDPATAPLTSYIGPSASYGGSRPSFGGGSFGGGFERGPDRGGFATREELPLPSKPPYTAHLGNLSFDATEGDIQDFFMDCDVTSVRVVEDKLDRKPKGFGYVEFGTLDGLKKALALSGTQFQGRNIRVSVAEPPKDRMDTRVFDDWTRKGPLPPIAGERPRGGGGGFRSFDSGASDAGSDRGGRTRDFGTWERRGPLSPTNPPPSEPRKPSPSWGEGRSEESRPPRREFSETRPPREPTAPELDNKWRDRMRPVETLKSPTGTPEGSSPSSPVAKPAAPAGRPRLNLQKRTVSETPAAPTASGGGDAKSSPFGAARPIDTAAKEREIEEKRQLALRQKKESDDKARDEKRAKEAAAKTEKAAPEGQSENGGGSPAPASNFEVLESEETGEGATDENANGTIVDDKAVKPKEVVRDAKPAESSWRRKESAPAAEEGSTTQDLEDDGWSTVPAKAKNSRRGGSRAIAS
ncbi:translation initiation factor 4b [Diplodia corticola]|uniref:Translation initiation factor 4b n=1 Tax=Diplodia corticola TaxID=236234 RepID=A0A1J9QNY8_9PEZI|nr:translation initiation factor 4b [Diplodia corticola]OJD30622.1 translation initiation factor 4b [Diplodia corticola]